MSAIAGIIAKHGQPVDLSPALHELKMYGDEEGSGVWSSSYATLAYQHRAVTYRSQQEQQPLQRGPYVIVADARIDNIDDLKSHHIDTSGSDSDIILQAYEKWGDDCPKHLIGDYAFAIWNIDERTLYCARDHIGARPFYYYDSPDVFVFTSDLRAIIALDEVPDVIDEQAIAKYLLNDDYNLTSSTQTFLSKVYKLHHAHFLLIKNQYKNRVQYWHPKDVSQIRYPKEQEYVDALSDLLETAVGDRLSTPYNVASHFSGGLDSTSVAVIAAHRLQAINKTLRIFPWATNVDPIPPKSDLERILVVANSLDLEPEFLQTEPGMFHTFDLATRPYYTLKMPRLIERHVQHDNVRVILSGWGGDEAISYYGHLINSFLFYKSKFISLYHNLRPQSKLNSFSKAMRYWVKTLWQHVFRYYVPEFVSQTSKKTYDDQFASDHIKKIRYSVDSEPKINPYLHMYFLFNRGHLSGRIESWFWSGAEHNITYGYPLLDRRVLDFAYGIPIELHMKNGWNRYIFRHTVDRLLPQKIAWNKMGNVKTDTVFFASKIYDDANLYESKELYEFLQQVWDCPWIAINNLESKIKQREILVSDKKSIYKALMILNIWLQYKYRNKH